MSEQKFNVQDGIGFPDGTSQITAGGAFGDNNIWIETFASDSPGTDTIAGATSVEYDAAGNIVALFNHFVDNDTSYTSVAKLTPEGALIWQTRFTASLNTDGWGLAYDTDGDYVYIAGTASGTPLSYEFATLTKLNGTTGVEIWSKTYDFEANSTGAVVDVDSDGNPIMVGYAFNGTDRYITTSKIDQADGLVMWTKTLDGQGDDEAYGMAVGPDNEIVTIGWSDRLGAPNAAASLFAAPAASNPLWTVGGSIATGNFSVDYTFTDGVPTFTNLSDADGNRVEEGLVTTVLGSLLGGVDGVDDMEIRVDTLAPNDTDDRMIIVKYAANGTIAWQKAVQFDDGFNCTGADADIDADGNIYVCGQYQYPTGEDVDSAMSIVKFNSSGVKQWSRRVEGDCQTFATSIVVHDNHLYLSGITGVNATSEFIWCIVKYDTAGALLWQRLIDNTAGWTFGGSWWFGNGGGSNIAVRNGYIALAGGFGDPGGDPAAAVIQLNDDATPFTVGDWEVKDADFIALFDATASDITVVNAAKIASTAVPTEGDLNPDVETGEFLTLTRYGGSTGASSTLVNGEYSVTLENNGTVTLPAGGTIKEGYVTSNPTIQLTPASPDVTSQKLVIKGGGNYTANDNGIALNWYIINPIVGDVVEIYVNSPANANGTLYWWITPENAGIASPESGTVTLTDAAGNFSFTVDSDDYEFTVRVSPEDNNYDPANIGVETQLFNSSAPTFDADHHLHLTTGNLAETSIFLGTDDHNVRTTVNGDIEITTPNIDSTNVWRFGNDGTLSMPEDGYIQAYENSNVASGELRSQLRLDAGSDITRLSGWSARDSQVFSATNWTVGEYTNAEGEGLITFTGAEDIVNWIVNNPYADRIFLRVNNGPLMRNTGYGIGGFDISFSVPTPPTTSPTTVTTLDIYYQLESRIDIDTDDQEFYIQATDSDMFIETRQNGSITITGSSGLSLRNQSNTTPIQIETDGGFGGNSYTWSFSAEDGSLTFPDSSVQTGAAISIADLKTLVAAANTYADFQTAIAAL